MTKITISDLKATDVLGLVMFGLGLAVIFELVSVPGDPFTPGVVLMILGTGAVFGRDTFIELVSELVIQNEEADDDSEIGRSSESDDDESDDDEIGVDRPHGEEEVTATK